MSWGPKDRRHRRGRFFARNVGISHGGGQTKPMVLRHSPPDDQILSGLLKHPSFVRMAGHASGRQTEHPPMMRYLCLWPGIFATWAPRLHSYYADHLQQLLDHDDALTRNFENSVFAACTFNFGPQTVCHRHRDHANLPFGWCAITALGNYDYKKGSHLVLWDLGLVIEFPPWIHHLHSLCLIGAL